jgi:hypothetical protein
MLLKYIRFNDVIIQLKEIFFKLTLCKPSFQDRYAVRSIPGDDAEVAIFRKKKKKSPSLGLCLFYFKYCHENNNKKKKLTSKNFVYV